jgi:hypothetical protein
LNDGAELTGQDYRNSDIVGKDCGSWGWLSGGEGESAELSAVLKARKVGGEYVSDSEPELAAESSTLGDADVCDLERRGEEAVEADLSCSSREKDAGPVDDAVFTEAHVLESAEKEGSVDRVVGLCEVGVQEPGREAQLR